jgi:regulator of nonsense transcripts 2
LQKLLEQDKRNQEAYIKAGEIFEDRQHAYERMVKAVEKLQNGVQSLADLLNMKVPEAPTALGISKTSLQIVDSGPAFGKDGEDHLAGGIWDDDEERKFYEDILDLAHEVPPSILGLKQNGEVEQVEPEILSPPTKTLSIHELDEDVAMDAENGTKEDMDDDAGEKPPVVEDDGDPLQSGPAARLAAIFAALPEANNRTIIDKLAADFAYLNSKPARKRCYKVIIYNLLDNVKIG